MMRSFGKLCLEQGCGFEDWMWLGRLVGRGEGEEGL